MQKKAYIDQQKIRSQAETQGINLQNQMLKRDVEIQGATGTTSKPSPFFKTLNDAAGFWDNLKKQWNRTEQHGASGGW